MRFSLRSLAVLLLTGLLLPGPAVAQAEGEDQADRANRMPDFQAPSLDGQIVDTSKLHGRVLLVDVWATWCAPCIHAAPVLDRMYRDLRDEGLEMIGIAVQSGPADKVKAVVGKLGMSYPVVLWNQDLAAKIKGLEAVPTYILVNQNWEMETIFVGETAPSVLRGHVERLLSVESPPEDGSR
jgi:thiol-disulfide isomerase/thioredoxin